MNHDVSKNVQVVNLLSPVAKSATFTSNWVDRSGSNGGVMFLAHIGADSGTLDGSNYLTVTYEESDTTASSDATAVAAADMLTTFNVFNAKATYENTIQRAEYRGNKRYVRLVVTETGTTNLILGLTAIKGGLLNRPSAVPAASTAAT